MFLFSLFKVSKKDFDTLVNQTAFVASLKEQRPILTALNLEAVDGVLTATATDSARMARKTIQVPFEVSFVSNIPAKMMVEVNHLTENENEINDVVNNDSIMVSKVLDGTDMIRVDL